MKLGRPPKLSDATVALAAKRYEAGASLSELARAFGCGAMTLHRAFVVRGIPTRSPVDLRRGKPWSEERRAKTPRRAPGPTRAELSARAIGNKAMSSHGYVRVNLGNGRRQYEHILIAERVLGRPLHSNECVHHINCNPSDNRSSNLLICTHSYHRALHARMRAAGYP